MKDIVVALTCMWFVFLSVVAVDKPEFVGKWQAKAEYAFILHAEEIGMWSE